LLCFDIGDLPHESSIVVSGLVYGLIGQMRMRVGTVVKKGGRHDEDEGEDHDANHVILDGPSLERPK